MPNSNFISQSVPFSDKLLNGGLNSTAGPLALQNNESSDLQNIDFNKFGSILKRNGYLNLNTVATTGTSLTSDGLYWFEYDSTGTNIRYAIKCSGGRIHSMPGSLNGTWTNITGDAMTAGSHCSFEAWLNTVYITNGVDVPRQWDGITGTTTNMTVPTGLTTAKYVKQFNNYLFLANVTVSSSTYPTRVYYSNINVNNTWTSTDWLSVSINDGQEITGLEVLSDRLVVFKTRSIYNIYFTGDSDIPFILPGGGKSNSSVGCVAPGSIQSVMNGLVFLAQDGLYYYDGNSSEKISDRITTTLQSYNTTSFGNAVSCIYRLKNRYMLALPESATNNKVIVWDYYNNAFSLYTGMSPSAMAIFWSGGVNERPYFSDYSGYDYRMDTGTDDYPLKVQTAINAYYWTNWKSFEDLINQKGLPGVTLFYQTSSSMLTFGYSYDFETGIQYSQLFSISGGSATWDNVLWDNFNWAGSGGRVMRRDLTGRGRVVRFYFTNSTKTETFQIDGFGTRAQLETMA